jgi:ornithine carbamoyltransferase
MSSAVSAHPPGGLHQDPESAKDQQKARTLGLTSATGLVVGTVIGAGVFTMPAVLASAGTVSLVVLAVIAVGAMVLAVLFGQLTRRVPNADGGLYAYARHEFGDLAVGSGARLSVTDDVNTGVAGVDFVYTDVWLSLGEPEDQWGARIDQLLPYQVNAAVLKATGNPAVKFLHCLPALHNRDTEIGQRIYAQRGLDALEVTDEVFESPASVVFDQAENRMHTIKALMIATLGPS